MKAVTHIRHQENHSLFLDKFVNLIKNNVVAVIAVILAIATSFIVPPDAQYLDYFDFKTLSCLFSVLAVVCALRNVKFFTVLSTKIVSIFKNARSAVIALVYVTFLGSMLIANDMALLTFLPLGYAVISQTKNHKITAFTFIMQNISANLGGMLTPFGNPQNLYLYTAFNIPTGSFMLTMLIPFLVSVLLITVCCLFVKPTPLTLSNETPVLPKVKTIIYLILFAISIIMVFRFVHYLIGLIVIAVSIFILDKNALKKVDYGLLLTFFAFFIFSGNMARIEFVKNLLSNLMDKNPLLFSALSCQVISNVPSAILLSKFTSNWQALLLGVNIGGVGTLISSLASLITFREFTKHYPNKTLYYVITFSIYNFTFLFILLGICSFLV